MYCYERFTAGHIVKTAAALSAVVFLFCLAGCRSCADTPAGKELYRSAHVSLDSDLTVMGEHRGFLLFCIVLGLLATAAIIALLVFNIKTAEKFDYSKKTWYVQMISALVISLPMLKIWEMLFEYLQKTF